MGFRLDGLRVQGPWGCGHLRAVFVKAVLGSGVWGVTWGLGCKGSAGSGLLGLKSLAVLAFGG